MGGGAEQAIVTPDRDELKAELDHPPCVRGGAAVYTGSDAVRLGGREDRFDGLDDAGVRGLERGRTAQRQAQVRRADVDAVEARGGGKDLVEIVEGPRRLDHGHGQNRLVRFLGIVGAGVHQRPRRTEAAVARGRIATGADEGHGLRR